MKDRTQSMKKSPCGNVGLQLGEFLFSYRNAYGQKAISPVRRISRVASRADIANLPA